MHCRHVLAASDLVPIFSYLVLQGKCRYCHTKISRQYPLVEAVAAVLGFLIYLNHPEPIGFLFWFAVWMVLLFTVVYDVRHTIIPYSCSLSLLVLAVAYLVYTQPPFLDLVAGPLLAFPLLFISLISWGRWMGWSDSLLELSLASLLGLSAGFTALVLAFWSGALVGSVLLLSLIHI